MEIENKNTTKILSIKYREQVEEKMQSLLNNLNNCTYSSEIFNMKRDVENFLLDLDIYSSKY